MALELSDFGVMSASLQTYADKNGLIPEPGENWQDFQWSHLQHRAFTDPQLGGQCWHEFCQKAIAAINQAIQDLAELEESPTWYMGKPH